MNHTIAMRFWKAQMAFVALAIITVAMGARALNCASVSTCKSGEVTICSPCCETPSCARAVQAVNASSPRLDVPAEAAPIAMAAIRELEPQSFGKLDIRVAHPPPPVTDRLALLSVLLI